jgi:hypothetical protein
MSNDTNDNLPDAITSALRDVPAVDPAVREANIEAALAAFDAAESQHRGAVVTSLPPRRRALLATAAAVLVALGAGAGWAARGTGGSPAVMDVPMSTDSAAQSATVTATTAPPPKSGSVEVPGSPVRPESGLPCASQTDGALYLGQYVRDDVLHLVFVSDFTIEVLRADTCEVLAAFQQPVTPAP